MKRNPINMEDILFEYERDLYRQAILVRAAYIPKVRYGHSVAEHELAMQTPEMARQYVEHIHHEALLSLREHYYGELRKGLQDMRHLLHDFNVQPEDYDKFRILSEGIGRMLDWCLRDTDDHDSSKNASRQGFQQEMLNASNRSGPTKITK